MGGPKFTRKIITEEINTSFPKSLYKNMFCIRLRVTLSLFSILFVAVVIPTYLELSYPINIISSFFQVFPKSFRRSTHQNHDYYTRLVSLIRGLNPGIDARILTSIYFYDKYLSLTVSENSNES